MKVSVSTYQLKLRDPFTIARGTLHVQPTMVIRLEQDGLVGLGEATTNEFYGATLGNMSAAIERVTPRLKDWSLDSPIELWSELDPLLRDCRFAQCALDCAAWDLYAQMQGLPLWKLWGLSDQAPYPPTCYTIGLDTAAEMVRKLLEMPDWPIYKIKLDERGGMDLVRHLRNVTHSIFRVDANCSWRAADVLSWAEELAQLEVELIEQPLPASELTAMKQLKGRCPIPLMADESCQVESDVERCSEAFDAINIKLVKCGGLTPAKRMIARARQDGLKVMVGCMTESSVGIAAGVHLLPLLDYADLDGALLLAEDIAAGLHWDRGHCQLPLHPGLGVRLVK